MGVSILNVDEKEIEYHRFPIHDRSLPESVQYMRQILNVLRDNEERNRITAVHCRGGIGQTGMVVG
jgi:protein-tyrosine phosphatase